MAGCSKCRYAARGCRRCVENFVPASTVRAAKAAEKYGPPAQPLKPVDANAPAKRPRGRPPGSKNKRDSGTHPKTPALKAATAAKAAARAILSPPSAAKSEKRAREEVEDDAHARARRPAPAPAHAQAPTPAPARGPDPRARGSAIGPFAGIRRRAPAGERPLASRRAPRPRRRDDDDDDERRRDHPPRRGRRGSLRVRRRRRPPRGELPPELREALAKVSESHATKVSQARGGVGVGGGALEARMAAAMIKPG